MASRVRRWSAHRRPRTGSAGINGSIRSHIASVITNRTGISDQLINPSKRHALAHPALPAARLAPGLRARGARSVPALHRPGLLRAPPPPSDPGTLPRYAAAPGTPVRRPDSGAAAVARRSFRPPARLAYLLDCRPAAGAAPPDLRPASLGAVRCVVDGRCSCAGPGRGWPARGQRGRQVRISRWTMCASGWMRPVSTSHRWMAVVTSPPAASTRRAMSAAAKPPVVADP